MTNQNDMKPVSIDIRYLTAWNEVNTRITLRQNALSLYITLVLGIAAALLTGKSSQAFDSKWLSYGFPIISLVFAFLNLKHELTIRNLRLYLCECEKLIVSPFDALGYHATDKWSQRADNIRIFHDVASALLVLSCSVLGWYTIYSADSTLINWNSVLAWIFVFSTLASVLMTLYPSIKSKN
jgi:hypothetical protein